MAARIVRPENSTSSNASSSLNLTGGGVDATVPVSGSLDENNILDAEGIKKITSAVKIDISEKLALIESAIQDPSNVSQETIEELAL